jgi:multidrug efflux pump subunit AcrB
MLLSVAVALILTPVLCASLLKPVAQGMNPQEPDIFSFDLFSAGSTGGSIGAGTAIRVSSPEYSDARYVSWLFTF